MWILTCIMLMILMMLVMFYHNWSCLCWLVTAKLYTRELGLDLEICLKMSAHAWVFSFYKIHVIMANRNNVHEHGEETDLASRVRAPGGAADHWRSYSPCLHNTWNKDNVSQQWFLDFAYEFEHSEKWKTQERHFTETFLPKPESATQQVYFSELKLKLKSI